MGSHSPRDLTGVRETIYQAISEIRLIDPHTHINPHAAASTTLADILGYHYYTELVHSAGMPREEIEEPNLSPRELVGRMVGGLGRITNTANYHWLIQICQQFFGFGFDEITRDNWEALYDAAESAMSSPGWAQSILDQSNVEAVFLTNDFDDDLAGFDVSTYIPCLRTDDLVFHLAKESVRDRLRDCSGIELDSLQSLRDALEQRFQHFVSRGARACAISIPPTFIPTDVSEGRAVVAMDDILAKGTGADPANRDAMSRKVFWTLAELCEQYRLPFDLMIGVNRGVYPAGVYQGQDLYDSRVSLIQYGELFNAFPRVKFPISVLASVTNQELVSYSWIFPNVYTNGHWWYSNTPSFIHRDAAARLEAVPRNKQVAYYSDAYKLEFVLPKFDMYRRVLSRILAEEFVGENGWDEEKAIALGRQVLRGNVDEIFRDPSVTTTESKADAETPAIAGAVTVAGEEATQRRADDLDAVPTDSEIEATDLADVMLGQSVSETSLEEEIDDVPLDVGNILGEAEEIPPGPDQPGSNIHMLTGDGEFTPDGESVVLRPDPMTGELHFPVKEEQDDK
ncbi:MAG: glucuronate isomerase [Planctomycetota bacterium]